MKATGVSDVQAKEMVKKDATEPYIPLANRDYEQF
jgi:hypothetical protein